MAQVVVFDKKFYAYIDIENFHPSGQAMHVWHDICAYNKIAEFEQILDTLYGEIITAKELIDFLTFSSDYIYFKLSLFDLCKTIVYCDFIPKQE